MPSYWIQIMPGHKHIPQAQLVLLVLTLQLASQVFVGRLHVELEVAGQAGTAHVVEESAHEGSGYAAVQDIGWMNDCSKDYSSHKCVSKDESSERILAMGQADLILDHPPGRAKHCSERSVAPDRREHRVTSEWIFHYLPSTQIRSSQNRFGPRSTQLRSKIPLTNPSSAPLSTLIPNLLTSQCSSRKIDLNDYQFSMFLPCR